MTTLEEFKKHLPPSILAMPEMDIERIKYTLERFATIAFDQWLAERNKKLLG